MQPHDVNKQITSAKSIGDFLHLWLENEWLSESAQDRLILYYQSYKKYFGPYIKQQYEKQTKELRHLYKQNPNARVLEVGSGCGTEVLWLAMQGANITGIDIDHRYITIANERKEFIEQHLNQDLSCSFKRTSILELDTSEQFDIIFMEQVFHHLEPRTDVVKRLGEILAPGGHIIFSEPNYWNPLVQLYFLKDRGFKTIGEFNHGDYKGHPLGRERILPACSLSRQLRRVSIKKEQLNYFRLLPNKPWADRIAWIEQLTPSWLKIPFTHYNFVGKKHSDV